MEPEPPLVRLRLDLSYDGSAFSGWAAQPGRRTVEGVVAAALGEALRLPGPPALTVAGRTDAGVHARGQVVHADVPAAAWAATAAQGADRVLARLARLLPADVRARAAGPAPDGFDARFSALWRRYSYRVCDDPAAADPVRRHETLWYFRRLDVPRHERGGRELPGRARFRRLLPAQAGGDHRAGAAPTGLEPGRGRHPGRHRGGGRVLPQHGALAGRRADRGR